LRTWLFIVICLFLASLLGLELLVSKHPFFPWEHWFGFNAVFGFIAFVALILVAKYILRPIIKRKEDYYD
jgi:hypothetical protein